jgi:hypothetical protein
MKATIYKAPNLPIENDDSEISPLNIFLGGSIENGTASNWQEKITKVLGNYEINIFNPRRDNWDASWKQDISNPAFKEQVTWELDCLDKCEIIVFYFDPNTKSPITLMELGMMAEQFRSFPECLFVCCPDGYWRKGNIQVVCERYKIKLYETFEDFENALKKMFDKRLAT